jgi:hypothetical protein
MDIKDYVPNPGDIIVGDGYDWSAWLQHAVNGYGATHGCVVTYPDGSIKMPMVLSSEYNGCVHMLWTKFCSDPKYNIWLYNVIGVTEEEVNHALDYLEANYLDVPYAFLAWPWFGWKSLWDNVLNPLGKKFKILSWLYHDVSTENNWFTRNVFCTKQTWIYMDKFSELHPEKWIKLRGILHNWMPDTFQPMNLKTMLQQNPDIFRLEVKRENGIFFMHLNDILIDASTLTY